MLGSHGQSLETPKNPMASVTTNPKAKHSALDVAKFFLTLSDPEVGDGVSNLKVQKLCYYAQGFSLAAHGRPLFKEPIVAWFHGPVVEDLFHTYKDYGWHDIKPPTDFDPSIFSDEEQELLRDVWDVYGQYAPWKLRDMTHEEPPWKGTEQNSVITHEALTSYFRTQLVNG